NTDEQIGQYIFNKNGLIQNNDGLIIFHYRTDRIYQIIRRILDAKFENFEITAFCDASEEFKEVNVAFPRESIRGTLAEAIAVSKRKQLHVTETEKFAHLTFFLNGEREHQLTRE